MGAAGPTFGQRTQTPAPAQAGDDPSMAQPKGSTEPALQAAPPVANSESTVGLAPAEQPVNNIKPRVAGEVVPSSQETAAHNASIFEHDKQPILTHTFNFTAEQKQAIVDALAQEKGVSAGTDIDLQETMVVPDAVALKPVPDRIAQEMPWVKPYFYVKTGDRIALVNPLGKYVVAVIE
jgi:hypothetical protein